MKIMINPLQSLMRTLACLTVLLTAQQVFAVTEETYEYDVYIQIDTVSKSVTSSYGNITLDLIDTTRQLIDSITSGYNTGQCLTDASSESYTIKCNVGKEVTLHPDQNNPEYPTQMEELSLILNNPQDYGVTWLYCDGGEDNLSCWLGDKESPAYQIDCNKGEETSECGISSNAAAFAEMVPEDLRRSNWGSLASGFLGSCISSAFGSAQAMCSQIISALSDGDDDLAVQLIKALAPLNPEGAGDLSLDSLRNAAGVVSQRLGQLRAGNTTASNVSTQLFFASNQWLETGMQLAANDSMASDVTPGTVSTSISDFGKLGFFINLNATDGKYKNGSLASNSDFSSTMLTLGFDYRVRSDLVTGLAFNIGQSKTEYKSDVNGKMDASSYSFIIYNSFYKNNWYLDTSLTIGGDSYDQTRDPAILNNSFESEFHSMSYSLSGTVGYDFYIQSFNIAPFAQLTLGKLEIDSYREKETNLGGGGAALHMDDQSRDIGSFNAGAHFRYIATTSKGVFIPVLTLTLVNDFENDAQTVTGRFVGVSSSSTDGFAIKTEESDASYAIIGLGFSFQLKNGNAGFLNIENLQGYENLDQNRLTLGWRWEM